MAKRFTDTEKWRDPWFCSLTTEEKLFWSFLLDNCNLAGIWQVNWPLVNFYIPKFEFRESAFSGRIQKLKGDKWFIPKFISFQYGELQKSNRLHQRIIFELQKEGVSIPLKYPSQGVKDKDKEKDKDMDISPKGERKGVERKGDVEFDAFWKAYPKKEGKDKARESWSKRKPPLEACLKTLERQKASDQWQRDGGQFIPMPATWINQGRWQDEGLPPVESELERERRKWREHNERINAVLQRAGKATNRVGTGAIVSASGSNSLAEKTNAVGRGAVAERVRISGDYSRDQESDFGGPEGHQAYEDFPSDEGNDPDEP